MDQPKSSETPETPETPAEETPAATEAPETPAAPESKPATPDQVQEALAAIAAINQKLNREPTPDNADAVTKLREQIKDQMGWTDAQLDFHQNSVMNAVAPVQEELQWLRLEKSHADLPKYKEAMLKELSEYSPAQRANPIILEKVYYLAKGRAMEQQPPTSRPAGSETPKPKIAPSYGGMGSGTDPGARPAGSTLNDEQREYARRLGVPEDAYKRAMATKNVRELKPA